MTNFINYITPANEPLIKGVLCILLTISLRILYSYWQLVGVTANKVLTTCCLIALFVLGQGAVWISWYVYYQDTITIESIEIAAITFTTVYLIFAMVLLSLDCIRPTITDMDKPYYPHPPFNRFARVLLFTLATPLWIWLPVLINGYDQQQLSPWITVAVAIYLPTLAALACVIYQELTPWTPGTKNGFTIAVVLIYLVLSLYAPYYPWVMNTVTQKEYFEFLRLFFGVQLIHICIGLIVATRSKGPMPISTFFGLAFGTLTVNVYAFLTATVKITALSVEEVNELIKLLGTPRLVIQRSVNTATVVELSTQWYACATTHSDSFPVRGVYAHNHFTIPLANLLCIDTLGYPKLDLLVNEILLKCPAPQNTPIR